MAQQLREADREASPFAVDANDEIPVGLQLTWRLRALIGTGQLRAGERLPSFRRLAEWAGVNVNTVRSVYEGLEAQGLVASRHGRGTFVADRVRSRPELENIAAEALRQAREAGASPRELIAVALACASMPGEASEAGAGDELPDLEGECEAIEVRQELRRQIARLEAELARYSRYLSGELPTAPRRAVAHVAAVPELERTRDTLIAQLSEAQRKAARRAGDEARGRGPLGRAMSRWRSRP